MRLVCIRGSAMFRQKIINILLKGGCMRFFDGMVSAAVVCAAALMVNADVIEPGHHVIDRCVTITGLEQFPDIALIGAYDGPMVGGVERYLIKEDSCLYKGYKFNRFFIFWAEKSFLESNAIETLPLEQYISSNLAKRKKTFVRVAPLGLLSDAIVLNGDMVPDENPVVSEHITYRLIPGIGVNAVALSMVEKVTTDTNGLENREVFEPVVNVVGQSGRRHFGSAEMAARFSCGTLIFTPGFNGRVEADIIDCRGREVASFTRECNCASTYMVPVSSLSAGIYWLRMKSAEGVFTLPISPLK